MQSRTAQITVDQHDLLAYLSHSDTEVARHRRLPIPRARTRKDYDPRAASVLARQKDRSQCRAGAFRQQGWLPLPGGQFGPVGRGVRRGVRRKGAGQAMRVLAARDLPSNSRLIQRDDTQLRQIQIDLRIAWGADPAVDPVSEYYEAKAQKNTPEQANGRVHRDTGAIRQ